jgi:hypothetical protein
MLDTDQELVERLSGCPKTLKTVATSAEVLPTHRHREVLDVAEVRDRRCRRPPGSPRMSARESYAGVVIW